MAGPLARMVRERYPGAYDDLSDQELERLVTTKYPGVYDDLLKPPSTEPLEVSQAPLREEIERAPPLRDLPGELLEVGKAVLGKGMYTREALPSTLAGYAGALFGMPGAGKLLGLTPTAVRAASVAAPAIVGGATSAAVNRDLPAAEQNTRALQEAALQGGLALIPMAPGAAKATGQWAARKVPELATKRIVSAFKPSLALAETRAAIEGVPPEQIRNRIAQTIRRTGVTEPAQAEVGIQQAIQRADEAALAAERANPDLALQQLPEQMTEQVHDLMRRRVESFPGGRPIGQINPGPDRRAIQGFMREIAMDSPLSRWTPPEEGLVRRTPPLQGEVVPEGALTRRPPQGLEPRAAPLEGEVMPDLPAAAAAQSLPPTAVTRVPPPEGALFPRTAMEWIGETPTVQGEVAGEIARPIRPPAVEGVPFFEGEVVEEAARGAVPPSRPTPLGPPVDQPQPFPPRTREWRRDIRPSEAYQISRTKSFFDPEATHQGTISAGRAVEKALRDAAKQAVPEMRLPLQQAGNLLDVQDVTRLAGHRGAVSEPIRFPGLTAAIAAGSMPKAAALGGLLQAAKSAQVPFAVGARRPTAEFYKALARTGRARPSRLGGEWSPNEELAAALWALLGTGQADFPEEEEPEQ